MPPAESQRYEKSGWDAAWISRGAMHGSGQQKDRRHLLREVASIWLSWESKGQSHPFKPMTEVLTFPAPSPSLRREEVLARAVRILDSTTDVVAMMDLSGGLLYLNATGRRLLGLTRNEPLGQRTLAELQPNWAYEVVLQDGFPDAIVGGSWSGETALLSANGTELPVLQVVLAHAGEDGGGEFLSTICRDITDRKQKELERIESANRYDAAIRASGQVVFDWNTSDGKITYAGDTGALLGFSAEEMDGGIRRLREIVRPEDLPGFDTAVENVVLSRDPLRHEFRTIRRDASEIIVEARGCFFLDRQGRIGRMVGFLKNVTVERTSEQDIQLSNERLEHRVAERTAELEQANQELKCSALRQEAVARLGQNALAGTDLDKLMHEAVKIVREMISADCASLLEFDERQGHFRCLAEIGWPNPETPESIPGSDESQSGYTLKVGIPVISVDLENETRFRVSESVRKAGAKSGLTVCIKTGEKSLGVLAVFSLRRRDFAQDEVNFIQTIANVITTAIERSHAEEEIRNAQADAEAANRAKSEFLSRMSHELRTPLNAVIGFAQLLGMEEATERQKESINHISRAGRNLLDLINEVLDVARLDAGRVQFNMETVDVLELLQELSNATAPSAAKRRIELRTVKPDGGEPFVLADRERLKQVMVNLLSNGVKFNREGGTITLAVTRTDVKTWRISVTDTGAGIPQEKISRLFVPFERLGTPEGGIEGGTGLGLALCQRLVRALQGRIGVTSTVGVGSTFWIELPAGEDSPKPDRVPALIESALPTPEPAEKTHKVLYIEDDPTNFCLLERILAPRKDIKLLSALQGRLGLAIAREEKPDLILLDMNLPDMTGEQVLRTLKGSRSTDGIPVIAVTGELPGEREHELKALGITTMLFKPYKVTDITTLLERVLPVKN